METSGGAMALCSLLLGLLLLAGGLPIKEGQVQQEPISRVAFGSCSRHNEPQPLWPHIAEFKPDLWIWLGDVVYADTRHFPLFWSPSPPSVMKAKFDAQKSIPDYLNFSRSTPIIGTWDDHDYGINDGGSDYLDKELSKKIFLEFLDEPQASSRWMRDGVYGVYTFGPPGKRVKIILLDVRYNRDHPLAPDPDILGEKQWQWLENELRESDAQINIIGSGIQILPRDKPVQEKWSDFPRSLARLEEALKLAKGEVVLLSGDVHYAEIFKTRPPCELSSEKTDFKSVYEITSSGMTHCLADHIPAGFALTLFKMLMSSRWQVSGFFEEKNFGTIEILWGTGERLTEIRLAIQNERGEKPLQQTIVVGEKSNDQHRCISKRESGWYEATWPKLHSNFWIQSINYLVLLGPIMVVVCFVFYFSCLRSPKKVSSKKTK